MNKYRPSAPGLSGVRWLAALLTTAFIVACGGGGGGGEEVDPTTPTIAASGATRAVVRKGDTTPLPAAFAVTVTDPGTGTVAWSSPSVASLGSGNSLALPATATALAAGEHTLTARVTNPRNGRSAQTTFSLLVLADTANTDDDNDGLTYDDEKTAGTQPGNADSDNDGLADGAEASLGTNPSLADSDSNGTNDGVQLAIGGGFSGATLPPRSELTGESGLSSGLTLGADNLSITYGSGLNPDCVNKVGVFQDPIYSNAPPQLGPSIRCEKRAVRANVGVTPGEFRYFEARRFSATLQNIGQGIITPSAQLDPYCCYVDPVLEPSLFPYNGTPPSMSVNSTGGVFSRLIQVNPAGFTPELSLDQTVFYGFAVDYTGANPLVYVVGRSAGGAMVVSNAINPGNFAGAAAIPMLHGNPADGAGPHAAINLGASLFHYAPADVRAALDAKGVANAAAMAGGVGIHRW